MKQLTTLALVVGTILLFPLAGLAQESGQAARPADKQEQKQAERERKRKEKEDAQQQMQQAGTRCTRLKRKQ